MWRSSDFIKGASELESQRTCVLISLEILKEPKSAKIHFTKLFCLQFKDNTFQHMIKRLNAIKKKIFWIFFTCCTVYLYFLYI